MPLLMPERRFVLPDRAHHMESWREIGAIPRHFLSALRTIERLERYLGNASLGD